MSTRRELVARYRAEDAVAAGVSAAWIGDGRIGGTSMDWREFSQDGGYPVYAVEIGEVTAWLDTDPDGWQWALSADGIDFAVGYAGTVEECEAEIRAAIAEVER